MTSFSPQIAQKIAHLNSETDDSVDRPPEAQYKQRPVARVPARWLRIPEAVTYAGINRSRLFALIAEGAIVSAAVKQNKAATRGIRLVDRFSLDQYLEKLCIPREKKLAAEATELAQQKTMLEAESAELTKKQKQVEKDLAAVRTRRLGVLR